MPGTEDDPVRLDMWQNIIAVGWGGPFVLLGLFVYGQGAEGLPEDAVDHFMRIEVKTPVGNEGVFIGRKDNDQRFTEYPPGEGEPKRQIASQTQAIVVQGLQAEGEGPPLTALWTRVYFINFGMFIRQFGQGLINSGSLGLPAAARWAYFDGNNQVEFADMRGVVQLYQPSAIQYMPSYAADFEARLRALWPDDFNPGVSISAAMPLMTLPSGLIYQETTLMTSPGAFPNSNIYDLHWDYYQRNNIAAYPPAGARPIFDNAV